MYTKIITYTLTIITIWIVINCYQAESWKSVYSNYCNQNFINKILFGKVRECMYYTKYVNATQNQCTISDYGIITQTFELFSKFNPTFLIEKIFKLFKIM